MSLYIYSYCTSQNFAFLLIFVPIIASLYLLMWLHISLHMWLTIVTFPVIVIISHYHKFRSQKLWIPHKVTSYRTSAAFFSELQLFLIIRTFWDFFLVIAHLYLRNSDHFSQWRLSSELQQFYTTVNNNNSWNCTFRYLSNCNVISHKVTSYFTV